MEKYLYLMSQNKYDIVVLIIYLNEVKQKKIDYIYKLNY